MQYTLRDYQDEMSSAIVKGLLSEKHPFAAIAATAAGKSLIIAEVCHRLNKPVLILQPSKEILEQNYAKLKSYGITDIGLYSASVGQKDIKKYTFATIQSIYKNPELFKHFQFCIIDECHQVAPKNITGMYMSFFRATGIKRICGLTATGYRLEKVYDVASGEYSGGIKMLNRITRKPFFKKFVYKVEMKDLIQRGFLTQPNYVTEEMDLSALKVNTTGANYTEDSLELWSNEHIGRLAPVAPTLDSKHQRVLVFCASLKQAAKAVQILEGVGIHAECLDGKTPKREREDLLQRFQDGRLRWVVNVGTMTTGFDCPPLDAVVLFRPTMSVALYVQMVGRCVRLDPNNPNKEAWVYDFTGTVEKFGQAEDIHMEKEDGFKDMLMSGVGRIDNTVLFSFEIKNAKKFSRTGRRLKKPKKEFKSKYASLLAKV